MHTKEVKKWYMALAVELYEEFQKSKPINIRLPLRVINRLKQVAIEKGIAYQTLIRLWIVERLKD